MHTRLKIAQVVCHLPPDPGGIGMVAHSYADQLTERGQQVDVFVPRSDRDVAQGKAYRVISLIPWLRSGLGAFVPQLLWRLWSYDIVHWHYPFLGSTLFVVWLLKKIKKDKLKLVITYHMDVNLTGWRRLYEMIFVRRTLPLILAVADKIIVSSADYIENSNIQDFYFREASKFVEIPFGVPRIFKPLPKDIALLDKWELSLNDKVVLFVGGLDQSHYFKGVNYLIKAISLLDDKNTKALIVGEGNLKSVYQRLARELNVSDRVVFTGYIDKSEIVKYYNLGDFLVLPSINSSEAFGLVLIEAMACGKPVIASNLKGVRSVVDPGMNGLLIEPKNSRDLAEKIKYFVENPEVIKRFSDAGLATVEKRYRWSVITNQLEELYYNLLVK